MAFRTACALDDLWGGEMTAREVGGTRVLLVKLDGDVLAYEDRCAHLGLPVSGGSLEGGVITCPAHHWQYDARSGQGLNPRSACLRRFPVRSAGGEVQIDIDGEGKRKAA